MRTRLTARLLAFVLLTIMQSASAQEVQKKLDKQLDVGKQKIAPLPEIIDFLSKQADLPIELDLDAFRRNQREVPNEIRLPRFLTSVDGALRETLTMAGCVYEIRGNKIAMIPNIMNGKGLRFPDFSEGNKKRIQDTQARFDEIKLDIEREITAPLLDVIEFLGDRTDVSFVFDRRALREANGSRIVEDVTVKLSKSNGQTLSCILKSLLKQLDARIEVAPGYLRIVPASGSS